MRRQTGLKMGFEGPKELKMVRGVRQAGTTLVEILVVIVVFLVGILAVIQIFPRGLKILDDTRTNAMSRSLVRAMIEQIKMNPDQLPEEIFAVRYDGNNVLVDPQLSFDKLALLQGDTVDATGMLSDKDGKLIGDWTLNAGPNVAKHIYHEGKRVPSPRAVGTLYGGLMLLNYGPIGVLRRDATTNVPINLSVVSNDLSVSTTLPSGLVDTGSTMSVSTKGNAYNAALMKTPDTLPASQFYVGNGSSGLAYVLLPTNANFDRNYLMRVSAYIGDGSGTYRRRDYLDLQVFVPKYVDPISQPLVKVGIAAILQNSNALASGESLVAIEVDSVRVAPSYQEVDEAGFNTAVANGDPFVYKIMDESIGALLFSPVAYNQVITRPDGSREALEARASYDVFDWRILHDEFRVPGGSQYDYLLPVQSLKVGGQTGPDGRSLAGIFVESGTGSNPKADHMVLVDVETGGTVDEVDGSGNPLISVDKSRGVLTIRSAADLQPAVQGLAARLRIPGQSVLGVDLTGRTLRVLYMARKELAVQPIKTASNYSLIYSKPGEGQCYPGGFIANDGSSKTRIYFPASDANRKVSVGTIYYRWAGDPVTQPPREILAQDFQIKYQRVSDTVGLPSIDIRDIDPNADRLDADYYGVPAKGVKGSSVVIRAMWNPGFFTLTTDPVKNAKLIEQWSWNWRRSSTETYLQREEIR